MKIGQATGLQIAFLMYAVMLLAVPLTDQVARALRLDEASRGLLGRGMGPALGLLLVMAFPRSRSFTVQALATRIPKSRRKEVTLVATAKLALAFSSAAAIALWLFAKMGPPGLDQISMSFDGQATGAFSTRQFSFLAMSAILAPIVEELIFRGFLYRAFERQWGWFAAMLASSALFGLYHPHFGASFASGIVFVCVLRRTGSLRAPILVHMLFNFMLWWPLLGQHVFPQGAPLDDPWTWKFHIACLAFAAIALPVYVWMSRDRSIAAPTVILQPNASLPK